MSKADELEEYKQKSEDIEREIGFLKRSFNNHFDMIAHELEKILSDEDVADLAEYLRYFARRTGMGELHPDASANKIKAFFLLFSKAVDDNHADRILSFFRGNRVWLVQ